ncbi:MAG: hypothetical protein ACOZAI_01970 [Pseudomonadota bacterium]
MNYKAFAPTDLPRGVPRYAATVLRDEKGGLYVSPRVANLDEMVAVMATNFDGAPSLSHKGHIYVPADWVRAEYAHHVKGLDELLDAMAATIAEQKEDATVSKQSSPVLEPFDDFISQPVTKRDLVLEHINDAGRYVQHGSPEGAIWRLEEALKLLHGMAAKEDK